MDLSGELLPTGASRNITILAPLTENVKMCIFFLYFIVLPFQWRGLIPKISNKRCFYRLKMTMTNKFEYQLSTDWPGLLPISSSICVMSKNFMSVKTIMNCATERYKYWILIGRDWSRDLNTGLLLVTSQTI